MQKLINLKVAQNVNISLGYFIFSKKNQDEPYWQKIAKLEKCAQVHNCTLTAKAIGVPQE
jgi:hypothetical protein